MGFRTTGSPCWTHDLVYLFLNWVVAISTTMVTTVAPSTSAVWVPTQRAGFRDAGACTTECTGVWNSSTSELTLGSLSAWSRRTRASNSGRIAPLLYKQPARTLSRSRNTASSIALQLAEKMADNADDVVRTKIHYYMYLSIP